MSRLSPFVLNNLLLSLLSGAPQCPFCPLQKRLKFAKTIQLLLRTLRSRADKMANRVCRDCPIPNCGAKYLVKSSNHLTDVHELDYINRRKWIQEAKLQPKVRMMIYSPKRSQEVKRSRSETPLSVQEEEKDTIVHQLSTPRGLKKSLSRGVGKAANNIKHDKTTADLVP